jgi:tricorn protease
VAESRYLRNPHLRGDLLTFVADDDVWLAPSSGGRSWRISADRAQASEPRLSGDGGLVAWTSWRDGPPEIYLAGTDGGAATRVSYWSNGATRLRGWNPAGDLLAITSADQPFRHARVREDAAPFGLRERGHVHAGAEGEDAEEEHEEGLVLDESRLEPHHLDLALGIGAIAGEHVSQVVPDACLGKVRRPVREAAPGCTR